MNRSTRLTAGAALLRRELASYFQTPVAYVVGVVFLGVTASLFFSVFFIFERVEMRQFFGLLPLLLALIVPALSMRLVAEERRRGTYELLASMPLTLGDVLAAKFLALWITGIVILAPTLIFVASVARFGALDAGPVAGGYLGAILLVGVYGSVGLFASSIARNETVALITGLVLSLLLALLDSFLVFFPPVLVPIVEFLSVSYHFTGFAQGVVDSRSLVYFVTLGVALFVVTKRHLERQR